MSCSTFSFQSVSLFQQLHVSNLLFLTHVVGTRVSLVHKRPHKPSPQHSILDAWKQLDAQHVPRYTSVLRLRGILRPEVCEDAASPKTVFDKAIGLLALTMEFRHVLTCGKISRYCRSPSVNNLDSDTTTLRFAHHPHNTIYCTPSRIGTWLTSTNSRTYVAYIACPVYYATIFPRNEPRR
jgi:hypothetical protein